jgi:hypothetical protein
LTSSLADFYSFSAIDDFMYDFIQNPEDVVQDMVKYYGPESLKLMDLLVKYNNTPAVLRK